jgi:hypothetical protein
VRPYAAGPIESKQSESREGAILPVSFSLPLVFFTPVANRS